MAITEPTTRRWTRHEYYQPTRDESAPFGYAYASELRLAASDHIIPLAIPDHAVKVAELLP